MCSNGLGIGNFLEFCLFMVDICDVVLDIVVDNEVMCGVFVSFCSVCVMFVMLFLSKMMLMKKVVEE